MLDLGFVRANLELVEEKLRARGADPAALLGDFRALDQSRREAITLAEQAKARRNELSQQVGALKRLGQDAAALVEETRALKDKLDELDQTAAQSGRAVAPLSRRHSQPHPRRSAGWQLRGRQPHRQNLGRKPHLRLRPQAALGARRSARHPRPGTRGQAQRRALCRLHGRRERAWSGR